MTQKHRLSEAAKGVYAISATPFHDDGEIDFDSIGSVVEFYIAHGVDGLTVLGMMGEAQKLSGDESLRVVDAFLSAVNGRIPVVAGASNAGVDTMVAFGRAAISAGCAGLMVAPLPTLRTDEQIFGYFTLIANRLGANVPLVLQDFPQVTSVQMSAELIGRLIDAIPQIVMLKHEDSPGLSKLSRLRREEETLGRRRISILVGNSGLHLPQELQRGADGAMTGFAFPEMLVQVCQQHASGAAEMAEDIFDAYLPLVRHESQPGLGLALRKEVLRRRGAIASNALRLPGPKLEEKDMAELGHLIARMEKRRDKINM